METHDFSRWRSARMVMPELVSSTSLVPASSSTSTGLVQDTTGITVVIPGFTDQTYQLGSAVLTGNTYSGGTQYNSAGCGVITVTNTGRFAGNLMNLTVVLQPSSRSGGCDKFEFRGELSK